MTSSLSKLVYNLAEGIYKIKCRCEHYNKKYKTCGIKYCDCECCLEYTNIKDDLIEYKCFYVVIKNTKKILMKFWRKRFASTYNFSKYNTNKFIL